MQHLHDGQIDVGFVHLPLDAEPLNIEWLMHDQASYSAMTAEERKVSRSRPPYPPKARPKRYPVPTISSTLTTSTGTCIRSGTFGIGTRLGRDVATSRRTETGGGLDLS